MADSISILYAEDDRALRKLFVSLLTARGYDVHAFGNGADAFAEFQRLRPDIVILDVMMPVMSGREVCESIRAIDSDVPILFHTAFDGEREELAGLDVGADDYISKTVSDDIFLARIAAVVRRLHKASAAGFSFGVGRVNTDACVYADATTSSRLSFREVELLRLFHNNPNCILTKDSLQTRLFGENYDGDVRSFDKTLERLRGKIGESASFVRTVPRMGVIYALKSSPSCVN